MEQEPVFRSIEQALHVSFLLEILPVTQKSATAVALDRAKEMLGIIESKEPSTVNFSGLSPIEVRGQCAMVRAMVSDHLSSEEADVIWARYSHAGQQIMATYRVREKIFHRLSTHHTGAANAMTRGCFVRGREKRRFSVRKIARDFGMSKSTVSRDMKIIRAYIDDMAEKAIARFRNIETFYDLVGNCRALEKNS